MGTRINYLLLMVGNRGTGKTTVSLIVAEKTGKAVIVINTDRHPAYEGFDTVSLEDLKRWNGRRCVVFIEDEDEADQAADILNRYQANAIIILEDAQKYISENISKPMKRLIINHRMRNFDLLFMYHFLKHVPPKIACNYNILFLFKTTDGVVNLANRYGNWQSINARRDRINKHKDAHYCEVIRDNE